MQDVGRMIKCSNYNITFNNLAITPLQEVWNNRSQLNLFVDKLYLSFPTSNLSEGLQLRTTKYMQTTIVSLLEVVD